MKPAIASGTPTSEGPIESGASRSKPSAPPSLAAERAAIMRRVASFRAHQVKLEQERTDYYDATQRRIAAALSVPPVHKPSIPPRSN